MKLFVWRSTGVLFANSFCLLALLIIVSNYYSYREPIFNEPTISKKDQLIVEVISYARVYQDFQDYQIKYSQTSGDNVLRLRTNLNNEYGIGDELNLVGQINSTDSSFDKCKGISGVIWYPKITILSRGKGLLNRIGGFRNELLEQIFQRWHGAQAHLLAGLLFGADLPYSDQLNNDFKVSGTLHLIAVSGFNINLIGNLIMQLSLFIGRRKTTIVSILILLSFYLLVGWESIPCLRAYIMYTFDSFGKIIGRKAGLFQSFGLALLIISVIWPYSFLDLSLQLSFAASIGLIILQAIMRKFNWINNKWYVSAFITSLSCSLATLPILMKLGNLPSYRSLIANTIISPLIVYTVLLGVISLSIESIFGFKIDAIVMLTDLILQTLLFFISISAQL